jgi:hypothetical protein
MSGLRQFLPWLWAAVWLRWRIVGVKTRRLLSRRPVAAAGMGYHLAAADIPVEGVDYDPTELPAGLAARLEETRGELLDLARSTAARRARRRRARRRRTFSLATAALVTLAVLGAGATALVTGSTGVPAVDRWLGVYEAALEKPTKPDRFGPGGQDLRPEPSGAGPSIEIPLENGSGRLVVASYVARSRDICSAVTGADRVGDVGDISCVTPTFLRSRLQQDAGIVAAVLSDRDKVVVIGFVTAIAERVGIRAPTGLLDMHLGNRWRPEVPGVGSLRPFIALGDDKPTVMDPRAYAIEIPNR